MAENFMLPNNYLNIAAVCSKTTMLGPGIRAAVWVQGCPFHCQGCIAPNWIPQVINQLISPAVLAEQLLENPDVTGITFSGGEPMLQAEGLAETARLMRLKRNISIICFSGFKYEILQKRPPNPGVKSLLQEIDILIDGQYVQEKNDDRGLRGSSNQKVIYLTNRLQGISLENFPRRSEILLTDGQAMMVGVPPSQLGSAFSRAIIQIESKNFRLVNHERT